LRASRHRQEAAERISRGGVEAYKNLSQSATTVVFAQPTRMVFQQKEEQHAATSPKSQ